MNDKLKNTLLSIAPPPFSARHVEYSMLFSADDDNAAPSAKLIELCLSAVQIASTISFSQLSARLPFPPYYPDVWPGEHYKLLGGFTQVLAPKCVIEIGTGQGLSALAIKAFLKPGSEIHSFDILDWNKLPGGYLNKDDFRDGSLLHYNADLCDLTAFAEYKTLLRRAEFIFVDGAKDEIMEPTLWEHLLTVDFVSPPILLFDDIRLWNMLRFWRNIRMPKLDITSFGHWSGTGIVEWKK